MIKALIFDFDGLIIDTETIWFEAYQEVLKRHGIHMSLEQFAKVIGTHSTILNDFITENLSSGASLEQIIKETEEAYHVKAAQPILRDGVEDYLVAAQRLGLKIGLASSSKREWVENYLNKLGIIEYFQVIKTSDDVKKVKPDPELYLKAAEALDIDPSEGLAFEDSLNGLIAARKAGLHCVIVPNSVTSGLPFEDYSLRLTSMSEKVLDEVISHIVAAKIR